MTLTFGVRSWEGILLRASPTPSGGAQLDSWDRGSKTWKPCDRFDKYMESNDATLEELAAARASEQELQQKLIESRPIAGVM
jgi:hypothetical protein